MSTKPLHKLLNVNISFNLQRTAEMKWNEFSLENELSIFTLYVCETKPYKINYLLSVETFQLGYFSIKCVMDDSIGKKSFSKYIYTSRFSWFASAFTRWSFVNHVSRFLLLKVPHLTMLVILSSLTFHLQTLPLCTFQLIFPFSLLVPYRLLLLNARLINFHRCRMRT